MTQSAHFGELPATATASPVLRSRILARCSTAEARATLAFKHAYRLRCLPIALIKNRFGADALVALVSKDFTADQHAELKHLVERSLVLEEEDGAILERAIVSSYLGGEKVLGEKLRLFSNRAAKLEDKPRIECSDQPVPSLLEAILYRALYLAASDIHLDPDEDGLRLRFRIDGKLQLERDFTVSKEVAKELTRRVRVLAALDITETGKPADGSFSLRTGDSLARIRVSVVPAFHGDKIVLRFLESEKAGEVRSYCSLGMTAREISIFRSALRQERGAILLSGPTGSGKSTLLYTALRELASEDKNVVTIEDPVERLLSGVTQLSVCREKGLDFKNLFETVLRQDPDVVMMGEIRDEQTARTALTASITGHLLLSTVHAGSAIEVVLRLQGLGIPAELMSSALKLIVSQRLLPMVCKRCRSYGEAPIEVARFFRFESDQLVANSAGCAECRDSGVNGRVGVFELLPITAPLRNILSELAPGEGRSALRDFGEAAFKEGYQPLGVQVRSLLIGGEISLAAAARVLGVEF